MFEDDTFDLELELTTELYEDTPPKTDSAIDNLTDALVPKGADLEVVETGTCTINCAYLRDFLDKAVHLDKKDSSTCITLLFEETLCLIYALNVGVSFYGVFGGSHLANSRLVFSLPIDKLSKFIKDDSDITFEITEDTVHLTKHNCDVSIQKPNTMFKKETIEAMDTFNFTISQQAVDSIDNTSWDDLLSTLNVYTKLNKAEDRLIFLDGKTAFIKGTGYEVFTPFETNTKYALNQKLTMLLQKLTTNLALDHFPITTSIIENNYHTFIANNFVLKYPIINAKFKFGLIGKIFPTTQYEAGRSTFKEALDQINIYSETKCAITLDDKITLINKTVRGTAQVSLNCSQVQIGELNPDNIGSHTYTFNHSKVSKLTSCIKGDTIFIMETNTNEHLFLTDNKQKHFIVLSMK